MDGIIIVDKPAGWTSHDVVARARRVLKEKRVGHTGTLDPFATGVLVLLVGRATRLAQFLAGAEKEYEATIRIGYATTTGDLTGVRRDDVNTADEMNDVDTADEMNEGAGVCADIGREKIEAALAQLRGEIEQVPPMYSAKKVGGKKLYELARQGREIGREAVRVRVEVFEIVADEVGGFLRGNGDGTCDVRARVVCSAGTYVRALAESLGEHLGAGAHLAALRRTRAGSFQIKDTVAPDELEKIVEGGGAGKLLIPSEAALPHLPTAHLTGEESRRVRHGAAVRAGDSSKDWESGGHILMMDERGALVAVGVYDAARGLLQPRVMLAVEK